jgi:hypothetical protein
LQASSVLRNEPEEEEKEEEMDTEVQQEEEEEKDSFYSSYKEAVQGEGREGVEDPLREVDFFLFLRFRDLKLFPQIRIYRSVGQICEFLFLRCKFSE